MTDVTQTPAELRKKWIDALRSGKYKQGQGALRTTDNRYCCLGVACDLLDPDGWELEPIDPETPGKSRYFYWREYSDTPPDWVIKAYGMDPDFSIGHLVHLNDTENLTFEKIADHLEKELRTGEAAKGQRIWKTGTDR